MRINFGLVHWPVLSSCVVYHIVIVSVSVHISALERKNMSVNNLNFL